VAHSLATTPRETNVSNSLLVTWCDRRDLAVDLIDAQSRRYGRLHGQPDWLPRAGQND
jgi:hypothetical protein